MSIFKKDTVVKSFPAFDIVTREPSSTNGGINLTAGESFTDESMLGSWYCHSVVSYALENNENPLAAIERAKANGHELKWINSNPTVLIAEPKDKTKLVLIKKGDVVCFEGELFTVEDAPNRNKSLKIFSK